MTWAKQNRTNDCISPHSTHSRGIKSLTMGRKERCDTTLLFTEAAVSLGRWLLGTCVLLEERLRSDTAIARLARPGLAATVFSFASCGDSIWLFSKSK